MNDEPRVIHQIGISLRCAPRTRVFLGLATGRYWSTGFEHSSTTTQLRLPFMQIGIVKGTVLRLGRISYMGWRGINHRPRPDLRVWQW